ncbi:DNA helicase MCM9 [Dissostichus eleginoides]|uniref:DNA helicase MCM9 n=1 Tax=Dissostichus eleginoides TaxID=100907 RepID=A0AAD9BG93_DISEL|nr:DNA helicase MCM9 [Dissostichus eleginoides]
MEEILNNTPDDSVLLCAIRAPTPGNNISLHRLSLLKSDLSHSYLGVGVLDIPYCTELGFASRPCRHAALCRMCLKLSSVPGREQYNQGSVLFKDCNVGSSNSQELGCFTAQLS